MVKIKCDINQQYLKTVDLHFAAYIRVFIFYYHIKYHLLNMLTMKCNINQQYLKTVDLHFVKNE